MSEERRLELEKRIAELEAQEKALPEPEIMYDENGDTTPEGIEYYRQCAIIGGKIGLAISEMTGDLFRSEEEIMAEVIADIKLARGY